VPVLICGLVIWCIAFFLGTRQARAIAPEDRFLVERALTDCPLTDPEADPWLLLDMLAAEDHAGLPEGLRGVTLAAACLESGYDPAAVGDCYCGDVRVTSGDTCDGAAPKCKAFGILQGHWWYERLGVDRRDPLALTWAWLGRLVWQLDGRAAGACPDLRPGRLEAVAWARAVRQPGSPRCEETPRAWTLMQRWQEVGR
jgi:hypothetical protein